MFDICSNQTGIYRWGFYRKHARTVQRGRRKKNLAKLDFTFNKVRCLRREPFAISSRQRWVFDWWWSVYWYSIDACVWKTSINLFLLHSSGAWCLFTSIRKYGFKWEKRAVQRWTGWEADEKSNLKTHRLLWIKWHSSNTSGTTLFHVTRAPPVINVI